MQFYLTRTCIYLQRMAISDRNQYHNTSSLDPMQECRDGILGMISCETPTIGTWYLGASPTERYSEELQVNKGWTSTGDQMRALVPLKVLSPPPTKRN